MEANPRQDQLYASLQESVSRLQKLTEDLRTNTPDMDEPDRFMRLASIVEGMKGSMAEGAFAPLIAALLLRMTDSLSAEIEEIDHYNFPKKQCRMFPWEEHDRHDWLEKGIPTGNPMVEHSQWWECSG